MNCQIPVLSADLACRCSIVGADVDSTEAPTFDWPTISGRAQQPIQVHRAGSNEIGRLMQFGVGVNSGAMVVDKYSAKQARPVALYSSGTAFKKDNIEKKTIIELRKPGGSVYQLYKT